MNELVIDINEQIHSATLRARPDEGTAAEAIERLLEEFFELANLMTFMVNVPEYHQADPGDGGTEIDRLLLAVAERGHADGSIDPDLTPQWITLELIWMNLFGAWDYVRSERGTRPEARRMVLRTVMKAIAR